MMASDDKKVKTNPAQKNEAPPKSKGTSGVDLKAEGGEIAADLPSGYSRGEGQKPVSKAYRDNWNVIFAKKKSDNSRNRCLNHGLRRGNSQPIILWYRSPLHGTRSTAFFAKIAACSSVCRFSLGSAIHSRMIARRASCSGLMLGMARAS